MGPNTATVPPEHGRGIIYLASCSLAAEVRANPGRKPVNLNNAWKWSCRMPANEASERQGVLKYQIF